MQTGVCSVNFYNSQLYLRVYEHFGFCFQSFNKHMKGRPHQLMMDGLSDKYKLKVDLLRHEMRVSKLRSGTYCRGIRGPGTNQCPEAE